VLLFIFIALDAAGVPVVFMDNDLPSLPPLGMNPVEDNVVESNILFE